MAQKLKYGGLYRNFFDVNQVGIRRRLASGPQRVLYLAIACDVGIAVSKFVASELTESSAMLADRVHSPV